MSQSSSLTTMTTRGGNTKPLVHNSSLRRVCMTINNYNESDYNDYVTTCISKNWKYVFGREIGSNGTPHLQCYLEFTSPVKFRTLKNVFPTAHIEKARGNRKQNLEYCTKDNLYDTNFVIKTCGKKQLYDKFYSDVTWFQWQQEILDLISTAPDDRIVNWYVDRNGNRGKSFLARYIAISYGCILATGKKDDIFNQVLTWQQDDDKPDFSIVICDVPRCSSDYVSYASLENLKNGFLYSGKYEGGQCFFLPPHVIVFSNEEPDYNKMSSDRWNVKFI